MALLHSTWLSIIQPWLYFTLRDSTLLNHDSTSLYVTLHYSKMALLHSTWLYTSLSWLYFTVLDSILLSHDSSSLYLTLHYSTMTLLHSTWLYVILYVTLKWLYFILLDCKLLTHGSTSHMQLDSTHYCAIIVLVSNCDLFNHISLASFKDYNDPHASKECTQLRTKAATI